MARNQSLPKKPLSTCPDREGKLTAPNLAEVFRTPFYNCSLKNVSGVPNFRLYLAQRWIDGDAAGAGLS